MSNFPIAAIRSQCTSIEKNLFFNSAGSSLPSDKSIEVIIDFIKRESQIGGYKLMAEEHERFEEFYAETAILLNTKPKNIAFSQSATLAMSQALYSIDWQKGDVILTSNLEYVSNVLSLIRLKDTFGLEIKYVDSDEYGLIDMNKLESAMKAYKPKALVLTHIPTNTGVVQDAITTGDICEKHQCIYLLDACQSLGHIKVDVSEIKCDFLSATGRKYLRAPRGTGFLYVSDRFVNSNKAPICIDLAGANWTGKSSYEFHKNAKRWEMWEKNYSNLLGLTQAIKEINSLGIDNISSYNDDLQNHYRDTLKNMNGVEIMDSNRNNCCIITWKYKDMSRNKTIELVDKCGVIYSLAMKESAFIDMDKKGFDWAIRFSPHYFNTIEEIQTFKNRFEALT